MPEMTIEAAMIELNRLKTTERMDIDRERLTAAIDVLKDAAQFRIKRKPEKIIDYVKKYSLVSRSFVIAALRCPHFRFAKDFAWLFCNCNYYLMSGLNFAFVGTSSSGRL